MITIRDELPEDQASVYEVNSSAFETDVEARLVDELRRHVNPWVSLVAELDGRVVGHIFFSPVSIGGATTGGRTMGLAPMAVLPGFQNQGIGTALVTQGIESCRGLGTQLVFVLGHAAFYPRFGFQPATSEGLHYVDSSLESNFFVLESASGSLANASGQVEYDSLFSTLGA